MKKQKFYPKQVLKKINLNTENRLSDGELSALIFFSKLPVRNRKTKPALQGEKLKKAKKQIAKNTSEAESVLANTNQKIKLKND